MAQRDLLIVAGEASGDLHAARVLESLEALRPGLRPFGLGGARLRRSGVDCVADAAEISAVGLGAVLRVVPRARRIFRRLLDEVDRRRPDLALLVDFPEFNLRLAKELRRRGVKVVYYVSPQVWAWRRGRVKTIARDVELMLVLFPFELDFYRGHRVRVVHVGHPLVDEVPSDLPSIWEQGPPAAGEPWTIALLPGSRASEVERLLPSMLGALEILAAGHRVEARLLLAPTVDRAAIDAAVAGAAVPVEVVPEDRFEALAGSHLALCASGTATLETGLLGTPMLVVYRLGRPTYWLGRLLVRLPSISLVNLVLGRRVVPELLQDQAAPGPLAREAARWLADEPAIAAMRTALTELRPRLGRSGASRRAAEEIAGLLGEEAGAGLGHRATEAGP